MKKLLPHIVIALGLVFDLTPAMGGIGASLLSESCRLRPPTRVVGLLPVSLIDEASGLVWDETSKSFFVANDSGDKSRFFRVRLGNLSPTKVATVDEIRFEKWDAFDLEDLSLGPCPTPMSGDCLALADIGDNRERRKHIEIGFIPMTELRREIAPKKVNVETVKRLKYPNRARNAEAFSILGKDRALLVTKHQNREKRQSLEAELFEIDFRNRTMIQRLKLNVPDWVTNPGLGGLVTGMSVPPGTQGLPTKLILLTYQNAIELEVLSQKSEGPSTKVESDVWKIHARRVLDLDYLEQQEAVAYDEKGRFYYTTEVPTKVFGAKTAPIHMVERVQCP